MASQSVHGIFGAIAHVGLHGRHLKRQRSAIARLRNRDLITWELKVLHVDAAVGQAGGQMSLRRRRMVDDEVVEHQLDAVAC